MSARGMTVRVSLAVLVVLSLAACAIPGSGRPGAGRTASRELLLADEIDTNLRNAYDAIARLRPDFLAVQERDPERIPPVAYLDGARLAGVEMLRDVPVDWIASIRWMRPTQAAGRYGADHASGAIFVTTRQRRGGR